MVPVDSWCNQGEHRWKSSTVTTKKITGINEFLSGNSDFIIWKCECDKAADETACSHLATAEGRRHRYFNISRQTILFTQISTAIFEKDVITVVLNYWRVIQCTLLQWISQLTEARFISWNLFPVNVWFPQGEKLGKGIPETRHDEQCALGLWERPLITVLALHSSLQCSSLCYCHLLSFNSLIKLCVNI